MLKAKFRHVHVWDDDLDESLDELAKGDLMLILAESNPKRPKRLNPGFYRKVLTQGGRVGWVHLDNCSEVDGDR
jgi:hypothetical protein